MNQGSGIDFAELLPQRRNGGFDNIAERFGIVIVKVGFDFSLGNDHTGAAGQVFEQLVFTRLESGWLASSPHSFSRRVELQVAYYYPVLLAAIGAAAKRFHPGEQFLQ